MGKARTADIRCKTKLPSIQQEMLGTTFEDEEGRTFMYKKYDDGAGNIPGIEGMVALGYGSGGTSDAPRHTITCDYGTAASDQAFAGILMATVENGEYCWVQTGGPGLVDAWTDGGVADQDYLVADITDASADGNIDTMADGEEEQVFGVAMADDETDIMLELGTVTTAFVSTGVTITGGTSAATGTLKTIFTGSTQQRGVLITSVSGTFSTGEALTTAGGGSVAAGTDVLYYRLKAGNYRIWRR